jgi:hypothetical protein
MSLRVNFPGDTSRMLIVDSCTTAGELIAKAAAKMQLQNYDEFALSVASLTGSPVPIETDDYMLDVLNASERYDVRYERRAACCWVGSLDPCVYI